MKETGKQSRRIFALVCGALVISLVVPAGAVAWFKSGNYAGATSAGDQVSFKATQTKVKRIAYELPLECDDETWFAARIRRGKTGVTKRGDFTLRSGAGEATSVITGKLRRRKASGTIATVAMNPDGATCSGSVDWTAKKS